jgi:hypothetical protein
MGVFLLNVLLETVSDKLWRKFIQFVVPQIVPQIGQKKTSENPISRGFFAQFEVRV